MNSVAAPRSPWWYRHRASTIAGAYAIAFAGGPVLTLFAGFPLTDAIDAFDGRFGYQAHRALACAAIGLVAVAATVRLWGSSYLHAATVWNADALDDRLIVAGPFAYVRNPLYFGNVLLAAGVGAFFAPLSAVLAIAFNIAIGYALAGVEAPRLRARFGATFDAYVRAVPLLVPRLRPWREASAQARPSLRSGLRSESFMIVFIAMAIALAAREW